MKILQQNVSFVLSSVLHLLNWLMGLYPAGIYSFKVNNGNSRIMYEISSVNVVVVSLSLTFNRFRTLYWCFIVDFE